MVQILIADDHALVRDGLASCLLRAIPGARVEGVATLTEALAAAGAGGTPFSLVLLDLRMPGMHGLEGLARFRAEHPGVPVALLTGLAEAAHVEQARALGAVGYFPKKNDERSFVEGVRAVLAGKVHWPKGPDGRPAAAYDHNGDGPWRTGAQPPPDFTARERSVIECLARGMSNKVIAGGLGVQEVTVKMHLRHVCAKLGVTNRTQAALRLRDLGFIVVE